MGAALALIAAALAGFAPAGFSAIGAGPAGGTVWQGVVPGRYAPPDRLPTVVYLPPNATPTGRYRLLVLLHGFPGSPYSFVDGLQLASVADALISSGRVPPFVAVMPRAGPVRYHGEWAGRRERFVVRDVVPWTIAHLPVTHDHRAWTIAGLSSGGYGAVDIGLRHPRLFGTLESWSGYYRPYRDGPLREATATELAAHDPSLFVDREAPLLRSLGTRFFVSCGSTHDRGNEAFARAFARRLSALRLPHLLWLTPGAHDGAFWRAQLPEALRYGLAAG
ncbi:MAG TPA: alpha/beta hydrolase-fold protein [Gaiellaceae bacterium]